MSRSFFISCGVACLAPEPARSIVDFLGLKRMPSLVSMTSSLVPSSILYFFRSLAGIVVWPFLVTTTSVSIVVTVVHSFGSTYKLSYQTRFKDADSRRVVKGLDPTLRFVFVTEVKGIVS